MALPALCHPWHPLYKWGLRVLCILALLTQMVLLDIFLVSSIHPGWAVWSMVDVGCVVLFVVSMVMSSNRYHDNQARNNKDGGRGRQLSLSTRIVGNGELPVGHIAWAVYGVQFCARLVILFE